MKMITVKVTALVDDDHNGAKVVDDINRGLEFIDSSEHYEWFSADLTSERPCAEEKYT